MKQLQHYSFIFTLCLTFCSNTYADLNVGNSKPTASEIINEFKAEPETGNNLNGAQNIKMRGLLCRGLSVNCDTPTKNVNASPSNIQSSKSGYKKHAEKPFSNTNRQPVCKQKSVSMQVWFDYKSYTLTNSAMEELKPLGEALASDQLRGMSFLLEGHTDAIGSTEYNNILSKRRANSVKEYLINNFAFKGKSINVIGKGKSELADPANPASEKNRRVKIIKLGC